MPGEVMCVVVAGGCVATSNDCENRNLSRRGGVVIGAEGVLSPASEATACSREEEGSFRSALDLTWSWCVAPAGSEMADEDEKTDAEAETQAAADAAAIQTHKQKHKQNQTHNQPQKQKQNQQSQA